MKNPRLFLSPPHMGEREQEFVRQAFESNYIAPLGPMVDGFEEDFSAYTGIPHCVALSSGTSATHLALRHLGIGAGDEVLASTLTFIGSVTPVMFEGATPVFVDCDATSWNMDPLLLEQALEDAARRGKLPKAVIPTDLYGQSCDLPRIRSLCDRHGVPVLCDSAESMGARYQETGDGGQNGGPRSEVRGPQEGDREQETEKESQISDLKSPTSDLRPRTSDLGPRTSSSLQRHAGFDAWASIFSFNGNKIMTTSGGGMLASHDSELIEHARKLSQQARDASPWYEHTEIGFNYRMSNILAAIGRGQLEVLDERVQRRREIFDGYQARLGDLPGISFMPEPDGYRSNRWLTVLLIDPAPFGTDTHALREALEAENIEARPVWKPMHLQPVFKGCTLIQGPKVISEDLFAQGLCLPSGTAMTDADLDRVCDVIHRTR